MTGYVNKVIVVDDLTDTVTAMTAFNAIHFTLVDMDTVFRYPNRWPGYNDLYNRLAFEVDVWVDPEALDRGEPVVIYRLEQSVPTGWIAPPISVSYAAIVEAQHTTHGSFVGAGIGLLVIAPVFGVIGALVLRTNRRNRAIPKPD